MRKIATMLVLMMTIGMVFAGAVSAGTVDVAVLDPNDEPVVVAEPGDEVAIDAYVETDPDEELLVPDVIITVDPMDGLVIDPADAEMTTDGINWITNDDPIDGGFFAWDAATGVGIWTLGLFMEDEDAAELWVPAIVNTVGPITVDAVFTAIDPESETQIIVDSDSYTFLSVAVAPGPTPQPAAAGTVPMQATGSPLAVAALGLLSIIGGAVYGKLR